MHAEYPKLFPAKKEKEKRELTKKKRVGSLIIFLLEMYDTYFSCLDLSFSDYILFVVLAKCLLSIVTINASLKNNLIEKEKRKRKKDQEGKIPKRHRSFVFTTS